MSNIVSESGLLYLDPEMYETEVQLRVSDYIRAQDTKTTKKGALEEIAREIYSNLEQYAQEDVSTTSCTNAIVTTPEAATDDVANYGTEIGSDNGTGSINTSFATATGNVANNDKAMLVFYPWEEMRSKIMSRLDILAKAERKERKSRVMVAVAALTATFKELQQQQGGNENDENDRDGNPIANQYVDLEDKLIPCGQNYKSFKDHHGFLVFGRFMKQNRAAYQNLRTANEKNVFAKNIRRSLQLHGYVFVRQRSDRSWYKMDGPKVLRDKVTKPLRTTPTANDDDDNDNDNIGATPEIPPQVVNEGQVGMKDFTTTGEGKASFTTGVPVLTTTAEQQQLHDEVVDANRIDRFGNQETVQASKMVTSTPVGNKQKRNKYHNGPGYRKKARRSSTNNFGNDINKQEPDPTAANGAVANMATSTAQQQEQHQSSTGFVFTTHLPQSIDPSTLFMIRLEMSGRTIGYVHFPAGSIQVSPSQVPWISASVVTTAAIDKDIPTINNSTPERSTTPTDDATEVEEKEDRHKGFTSPQTPLVLNKKNSNSSSNLGHILKDYPNVVTPPRIVRSGGNSIATFDCSLSPHDQRVDHENVPALTDEQSIPQCIVLDNDTALNPQQFIEMEYIESPSNHPTNRTIDDVELTDQIGLGSMNMLDDIVATGEAKLFNSEHPAVGLAISQQHDHLNANTLPTSGGSTKEELFTYLQRNDFFGSFDPVAENACHAKFDMASVSDIYKPTGSSEHGSNFDNTEQGAAPSLGDDVEPLDELLNLLPAWLDNFLQEDIPLVADCNVDIR